MVQTPGTETALTWTALINLVNTVLVVVVGFLLREAWSTIHRRIDELEDRHSDIRERVASLEAGVGWSHPHRRHGDSGAHKREE